MTDTFPRQYARTQRLSLGEPRDVSVSSDGRRIILVRSRAGDDPVNCLWVADAASGETRLVADPIELLAAGDEVVLPADERARRERMRESAGGVTAYATDAAGTVAAFALAGRLFVAGLVSGRSRELTVEGPVFDPRPDPLAARVAYVSGRTLRVAELDGRSRVVAGGEADEPETVSWGRADFVAAEEIHRFRGYWWSPDGRALAVCRVDEAPVERWYISDPAEPARPANEVRYPRAGTANPDVTLHVFALDAVEPVDVEWDRAALPYVIDVSWTEHGLFLTVQSRDQRRLEMRRVDAATGATEAVFTDDDDRWVELVPGSPATLDDGRFVVCSDRDGVRRLVVDGTAVTPDELQVRAIVGVDGDRVYFTANPVTDATVLHVWSWDDGSGAAAITEVDGVHGAAVGGGTVVLRRALLDTPGARWGVVDGPELESFAESPLVRPRVQLVHVPTRDLATALLLPAEHDGSPLPVLLDPYGGPHAQRVVRAHNAYLTSQWFADQGFAVVVVDGRGTPGRGTEFERAVHGDLATAVLDDQVDALHDLAAQHPELDLSKVAIRGWSFGGYLAALAVLARPDVFHAAIAGAPVTEWRLYDTHYTERYLGDPAEESAAYDASSLLPLAPDLTRPLLLVHGLADDNVVAAHTLQLSSALLAAGKQHEVLPLVGVTHMTPQEVVAENLLLHQLAFLRRTLALDRVDGADRLEEPA